MDSNRATKLRSRSRSRGGCAAAKSASMYDDDVFGSPALSPSEEDYIEIFGGFHGARGASGIPVLDLPPVDEKEALFDFRLFDYSEVFGGFEGLDYVVPFQELFRRSNGGYVSSSDDAWTNVETDCLSEEWDGSPYSSKCKSYGNESNQQSIEDGKQFHMSYQRKHQMNEEGVSNTAHVAPVRAVPGYAFVIDQIAPSQKIESQNSQLHIDGDDDKLIKRGKREEEFSEKLASAVELEKGHVRNGSQSNEMYVTISEINLRTLPSDGPPPSRPPPIFDASYGNSREATSSLKATCNSKCFSRSTSGNDSPPFVDVELDARISATESAASVTESVMNSQAQPKTIKENLQLKNVVMSQVSVCPKDEAKCNVAAVGKSHNSCKDQEDDTCTLEDYAQHPSRKESYSGLNNAQSLPDVMGLNPMLNLMGKNKSKQSWSSEESCEARLSGEWSKVPQFIELVRYGKTKTSQQESGDDIIVQNRIIKECVKEEKRVPKKEKINQRVYIATNKLEDHVKISEAVSKMSKQDKNYKEFHVSLQVEQCEEVERQVSEEDPQMEDDIFIEIMKNEHETEKELNKIKRKVKLGDDEERMEDPRKIHEVGPTESFVTAEDDGRVNDDLSIGPGEIDIRENCQQAIFLTTPRKSCEIELENLNEQTLSEVRKEAHNEQQNGRVMKSNIEQERREPCFKETFEDIKKRKKSLKESHVLEETKRKTKEIFEKEENERRKKEEEYVAKLMEASDNEADEMLKEALEEVNKRILMEDLERTEREKIMNMIAERTSEKQPDVRKVTRGGPIMMTGSRRSSNLTSEIDIGIEATNLRSYQAEKLKEENIFNSECDSEQENAKSTLEFITVVGKKSNYNQASDGGVISEYIPGAGTNEQLSDAKENINLVNGTSMSTNASGEAALHSDQIGVKRNNKLPNMAPDSTNLQKNVKVGKVTTPEKAQAQTKAPPHDDVNTDKDKLAQKADGEMTNSKGSQSTKPQMSGGRKQTQNQSHQSKTNQIVGGKEKCRKDNSTPEEREKLERLRKEREIELERLREMEEEWEREREREKDRVAFESVNRNFQEKAYPGLRERAAMDKASAEPRQKDLPKARERLEKSYSDKISMEAKMRQEQSAVERANVEAREHADRSILSSAAMHPSTSIYTDKVEGIEGESTQRCKAILERHQRTAERAAKALAEKNTRDLIAQREQAERHRLAESLDVEVKRWSNGKQGNLRALLSTLQYILGPESGWQPVPLTGIITSAAVKKAYRKATLCVHPDKLQQRRATIQQKYICEKVFDLLKEAWNRFNSEEP